MNHHIGDKASTRIFIKNIPFLLSGMAVTILTSTSLVSLIIMIMCVLLTFGTLLLKGKDIGAWWKSNITALIFTISICSSILFGCFFYFKMINSSKLQSIASLVGVDIKIAVALCALFVGVLGIYFFSSIIIAVCQIIADINTKESYNSNGIANQANTVSKKQLVLIFITAVLAITICSKSSPIYPFNDWMDANCFMTVGKSMLNGLVPYRDLYEQKGPLLYMLHALAATVSERTFIGVYFLEIIAAAFFLFFSFKIMKLHQRSVSVLLVPILAAVVYSAYSFCHGDSAEELCLPLFAFAVYLVTKFIKLNKPPTRTECLMIGITSSFVLWVKFSLLGFYLGWFCVFVVQLIKQKAIKKLFSIVLWIGIGVLIPTIPILIYFGINNSLNDLWTVYFYNNLFLYSSVSNHNLILSLVLNLYGGIENIIYSSFIPAVLIVLGLMALAKEKKKTELFSYLVLIAFTFLLVYGGGKRYTYYALIFSSFVPIGILAAYKILCWFLSKHPISNNFVKFKKPVAALVFVMSFIFAFVMSDNTYMLNYSRSDLPQYQFAEIINKNKDATLLNYGFLDGGFYTTTGIIPNCRYFCNLNVELDEIMETQNEFVDSGKVDFVVTRIRELESDRYKRIASSTYFLEGSNRDYFLYQLIK